MIWNTSTIPSTTCGTGVVNLLHGALPNALQRDQLHNFNDLLFDLRAYSIVTCLPSGRNHRRSPLSSASVNSCPDVLPSSVSTCFCLRHNVKIIIADFRRRTGHRDLAHIRSRLPKPHKETQAWDCHCFCTVRPVRTCLPHCSLLSTRSCWSHSCMLSATFLTASFFSLWPCPGCAVSRRSSGTPLDLLVPLRFTRSWCLLLLPAKSYQRHILHSFMCVVGIFLRSPGLSSPP